MSRQRELRDLLDEIAIHGTPESELLNDGFTQEEIDWAKVKNGIATQEQFDFRDYQDMFQCIRGEYFCGYASELIY